jgi:hypothetical protein
VPVTLTNVLIISIILSMPITIARPVSGKFNVERTTMVMTIADPGTPALPMVVIAAVIIIKM